MGKSDAESLLDDITYLLRGYKELCEGVKIIVKKAELLELRTANEEEKSLYVDVSQTLRQTERLVQSGLFNYRKLFQYAMRILNSYIALCEKRIEEKEKGSSGST